MLHDGNNMTESCEAEYKLTNYMNNPSEQLNRTLYSEELIKEKEFLSNNLCLYVDLSLG